MKTIRFAAVFTILMAILNIPAGPTSDPQDMPTAVAWVGTVVGIAGLVAAIAAFRRVPWARSAMVAIGLVNVAGGIAALVAGWAGGGVGIVLGAAAAALAAVPARQPVAA